MMKYKGKLVFLESTDQNARYSAGEYLCLQESQNALYCIRPVPGYYGHELKQFLLVGESKYNVVSAVEPDQNFLEDLIRSFREFVNTPKEQREWINTVYDGARDVLRMLESLRRTNIVIHEEKLCGKEIKIIVEIQS